MTVVCDHSGESLECLYGCDHKEPHHPHFDGLCGKTVNCGSLRVKCIDTQYVTPRGELSYERE